MLCYVYKPEVVTSPSHESGDWNVVVFRQPNMSHYIISLHMSIQPGNQTAARCMQALHVQPTNLILLARLKYDLLAGRMQAQILEKGTKHNAPRVVYSILTAARSRSVRPHCYNTKLRRTFLKRKTKMRPRSTWSLIGLLQLYTTGVRRVLGRYRSGRIQLHVNTHDTNAAPTRWPGPCVPSPDTISHV
jgi:hypothetical protein